jgi:hypothetical protein
MDLPSGARDAAAIEASGLEQWIGDDVWEFEGGLGTPGQELQAWPLAVAATDLGGGRAFGPGLPDYEQEVRGIAGLCRSVGQRAGVNLDTLRGPRPDG